MTLHVLEREEAAAKRYRVRLEHTPGLWVSWHVVVTWPDSMLTAENFTMTRAGAVRWAHRYIRRHARCANLTVEEYSVNADEVTS